MKHFNKAVMMLTLTALLSQISSFAQEPSVKDMQEESKGLIADLKAYAKCRKSKQGCPQELLDRMKKRGKYVAVGVAALAALGLGGYGIKRSAEEFEKGRLIRAMAGAVAGTGFSITGNKYKITIAKDTIVIKPLLYEIPDKYHQDLIKGIRDLYPTVNITIGDKDYERKK